jgi:hypothetical protein
MVPANRVAHDGFMRRFVWQVFAGSVWRQTVLLVSSGVFGAVERARVRGLSGVDIPAPATPERPPGLWPWPRTSLGDTVGWKGLAYGVLMLPWGVSTLAITSVGSYEFTGWGRVGVLVGGVVVGVLLLLVTPPVVALLTRGQVAWVAHNGVRPR